MGHFLLGTVRFLLAVQASQATVGGMVRDRETGEPLAGAVVTLADLNRATLTGTDGRYVLPQVPAGPQRITVRFIGHAPRTLRALVPWGGQLELNVTLDAEPLRLPLVVVRPPVIVRGVDSGDSTAFPDRETSSAAVGSHPLLAEPDVFQALGGGEVVLSPESPSGLHVRGGASDQTAYLLDGVPVFSPYHTGGLFSAWNPDALSRVRLTSAAPSLANPHALSGAVEAVTRAPGDRLHAQGGASTTQARLTFDGPLGVAGASYLISVRSAFPGVIAPNAEASYLRGETGDWLAKLELPVLGGRARLLGYDSENDVNTAAGQPAGDGPNPDSRRNVFEWHSRSLGAEWKGGFGTTTVRLLGWHSTGDAGSVWAAQAARIDLAAARRDAGLLAAVAHKATRATSLAGIRLEWINTSYRIQPDSGVGPSWMVSARTPVATGFAQHAMAFGWHVHVTVAASLAATAGDLYLGPQAQLRWSLSERLALSGSYTRTHQFAQSLRNAESVVGNVFPVDLYMGARAAGVPVARSDQGVVAIDYRPSASVHLGVQGYQRDFAGLLLVAPRDGEPFTTGAFVVGSGASSGVAVNAAASGARYGVVVSYGLQRVRLAYGDSSYVPDHAATHLLDGGVIVFPTATVSIRLGASAALGRRTTTVADGFEWEACNLLDQGCEFGGSPHYRGEPLGATPLRSYLRVDLGIRKQWQLRVGARDAVIALFGTVTNILGRKNVLTYARNSSTGDPVAIEMRPLAPLVVGLDWRF